VAVAGWAQLQRPPEAVGAKPLDADAHLPAYNHSGQSNPHRNLKGIDIRLTRLEKMVRRILILMMILAVVVLPGWAPVAPVQVPVTKPLGLSSISLGDLT
jgi:hypothetical protein